MAADQTSLIALRYARAWFSLAGDAKALDAAAKDAEILATLAQDNSNEEFQRLLMNPVLSRAMKAKVMEKIAAKLKLSPGTASLLARLALNNRLAALLPIVQKFQQMLAASRGETEALVTSAAPLKPAQTSALQAALEKALKTKVSLASAVNPALIAGLTVQIGGRLIDMSAANQLDRLKRNLLNKTAA